MSDRYISSGIMVVYDRGDQFFSEKKSALKFAESMEAMGHMCEFYVATIEGGKITRCRWVAPELLKEKVMRSGRP